MGACGPKLKHVKASIAKKHPGEQQQEQELPAGHPPFPYIVLQETEAPRPSVRVVPGRPELPVCPTREPIWHPLSYTQVAQRPPLPIGVGSQSHAWQ